MATGADTNALAEKMKKMSEEQKRREKVTLSLAQLEEYGTHCGTVACDTYMAGLKEDAKKGIFPDIEEVKTKIADLNKIGERVDKIEKSFDKFNANLEGARKDTFDLRKSNEKIAEKVFEVDGKLDKFAEKATKADAVNAEPHDCESCGTKSDEKIEKGVGVCSGDAKNGFACQEPRPKFDSHEAKTHLFCPRCGSNIKDTKSGKTWFEMYQEAEKAAKK